MPVTHAQETCTRNLHENWMQVDQFLAPKQLSG